MSNGDVTALGPIPRRDFLAGSALAVAALPSLAKAAGKPPRRPNIVFIMADDLGYADLGCYGARAIKTPRLDGLAAQGVRLTDGYASSCVCSATRTALITGRYQYRLRCGLEEPLNGPAHGLPPELPTLPRQLKALGYRTALVGKWHLGESPKFGPLKSGYDRFFGIYEGGANYFSHEMQIRGKAGGGLFDGERKVDQPGYMTDLLGERAVREIEDAAAKRQPLFLSLHFTAPHWPWEGPEDAVGAGQIGDSFHVDGGSLVTYAKMVEAMDRNVGKVLDALDHLGLADDTIVVFTSDNGGERFSDVWPFTGAKTELLEGGVRVPVIARWPKEIPAGSTSSQVLASMDFLPTLVAAAGGEADPAFAPDGVDLMDVLRGRAPPTPRKLYWRYKAGEQSSVRDGDWKYLMLYGKEHLFNLAQDPHERANLKGRHPERFAAMKADFAAWNAQMLPYPADSYTHSVRDLLADR